MGKWTYEVGKSEKSTFNEIQERIYIETISTVLAVLFFEMILFSEQIYMFLVLEKVKQARLYDVWKEFELRTMFSTQIRSSYEIY